MCGIYLVIEGLRHLILSTTYAIPILGLLGKRPVQILLTLHLCSCFLYGLAFLTNPNEFNKQIGIFYACMFLAEKP